MTMTMSPSVYVHPLSWTPIASLGGKHAQYTFGSKEEWRANVVACCCCILHGASCNEIGRTSSYHAVKPDAFHSLQDEALWVEFQTALDQQILWLVTCSDLIDLFMVVPAQLLFGNIMYSLFSGGTCCFYLSPWLVDIPGFICVIKNQGMMEDRTFHDNFSIRG